MSIQDDTILPSVCHLLGKTELSELNSLSAVFLNETIFFDRSSEVKSRLAELNSKLPVGSQPLEPLSLTLEHLEAIRADPLLCYQNVTFNSEREYEKELGGLVKALDEVQGTQNSLLTDGENPIRLILVDTTRQENKKSPELLKELQTLSKVSRLVRSYLPFSDLIPSPSAKELKELEAYFINQKLENNFFLDKLSPGLVGPFDCSNMLSHPQSNESLCFKAVQTFTQKYSCPQIVDLAGKGSPALEFVKNIVGKDNRRFVCLSGFQSEQKVASGWKEPSTLTLTFTFEYPCLVEALREGFYVELPLFSLLANDLSLKTCAALLKGLVEAGPGFGHRLVIGTGLKYKTQFTKFAGRGLKIIAELAQELKNVGLKEDAIQALLKTNALRLLLWWKPLKIVKRVTEDWECNECKQIFTQDKPKISKMDFNFCSPGCFKKGLKKINAV